MSSIAYVNLVMSLNHEIVRDRVTFLRSKGEPTALHEFAEALDKTIAAALSARVSELEDKLAQAEQVSGEYCEKCGWAMKFPGQPCRCELEAQNARLRKALAAEIEKEPLL
jgi:hypothetical protein